MGVSSASMGHLQAHPPSKGPHRWSSRCVPTQRNDDSPAMRQLAHVHGCHAHQTRPQPEAAADSRAGEEACAPLRGRNLGALHPAGVQQRCGAHTDEESAEQQLHPVLRKRLQDLACCVVVGGAARQQADDAGAKLDITGVQVRRRHLQAAWSVVLQVWNMWGADACVKLSACESATAADAGSGGCPANAAVLTRRH